MLFCFDLTEDFIFYFIFPIIVVDPKPTPDPRVSGSLCSKVEYAALAFPAWLALCSWAVSLFSLSIQVWNAQLADALVK